MDWPKTLTSKRTRRLKEPPRRFAHLFKCPACGTPLTIARTLWVCPNCLKSKAYTEGSLLTEMEEIARAAGYQRWTARGIYCIQRRVVRCRQREEAAQARKKVLVEAIHRLRNPTA